MKKYNSPLSVILILIISFFSSCTDDEPTLTELLTDNSTKAWKYISLTVDPAKTINGTSVTDWLSQKPSCEQDDLRVYNSDGTFTIEEGATTCGGPQIIDSGTWSINSSGTILSHQYPNSPVSLIEVAIESLEKDEFVYILSQSENGVTYKYTATLVPN